VLPYAHGARIARRSFQITPLAASTCVSLLNSVAISTVYARVGGASAFGTYQIALGATAGLGILALSGAGTAATRAAAQGRNAAWPLFRLRLPYAFAAAAVLIGIGTAAAASGAGPLGAAIAAGGVTMPLHVGADVYPAQLLGQRRYVHYFLFQLVVQSLTLAAVVEAIVAAPHEPWMAVLGLTGVTGVLQFGGLLLSRRESDASGEDVHYARRITAVGILSGLAARLDIILTGALLGVHEAGLLGVARTLSGVMRRIWDTLNPIFFVKLAATTPRDGLRVASRYRLAVMLALGGPGIAGIAAAPVLVPFLFGDSFRPAVTVTQLLLGASVLAPVAYLEAVLLKAQGDLRRLGWSYVVLPLVSILAMPPLVWRVGLNGVGITAILVAAVSVLLYIPLARSSVAERESPI